MHIIPLKSQLIKPKEDLKKIILQTLKKHRERLRNGDILVIASKVISISQGRIQKAVHERFMNVMEKEMQKRVQKEADEILGSTNLGGKTFFLTLKDGILIPNAGIDASNAPRGFVILWPEDVWETTRELWKFFRKKFRLKKIGIVITDSRCAPLRWGTSGIALAFSGFYGVEDVRNKKDLFGKKLKVTKIAVADNIASAALLSMKEAAEKIPFVLCRGLKVKFSGKKFSKKYAVISKQQCLFSPLYPKESGTEK